MRLRRIILGVVSLLLVVVIGGLVLTWHPAIPPISALSGAAVDERVLRLGAELAAIGNCDDCHVANSGTPYAGGRSIPTPFGTIFSSNISPDAATGVGTWSEAAFRRAMRDGVDREGRELYPAFPYDHFTKATDDDIHALYIYLMAQPPVRNAIPPNDLTFPFNFRPIVAGWKLLFLREARLEPDSSKSAEWNRGRYLVEGLGHCGACHTPRNVLGAEKKNSAYSGGNAEGWNAPPLNSYTVAAQPWTADQLAEYLSTGWHRLHGAAAGPMTDVTRNLGQASPQDVRAISAYVASLSSTSGSPREAVPPKRENPVANASSEVAAIYTGACANCHNDRNDVGPSKALPLSVSSAVRQAASANTIRVVLGGIPSLSDAPSAYMPAFGGMLTDEQIESLAAYVRARYTDEPPWTDIRQEISKARQNRS
jgi:mono/diheme cytochrome c family protein